MATVSETELKQKINNQFLDEVFKMLGESPKQFDIKNMAFTDLEPTRDWFQELGD
jgi:hypothetical protein